MFLTVRLRSTAAPRLTVGASGTAVSTISESAQEPSAGAVTLVLAPVPVVVPSVGAVASAPSPPLPFPGSWDSIELGAGSAGPLPGLLMKDGSVSGVPEDADG